MDGCRVDAGGDKLSGGQMSGSVKFAHDGWNRPWMDDAEVVAAKAAASAERQAHAQFAGRWPTNLLFVHHPDCTEECVQGCHVAELDAQSGTTAARATGARPVFKGQSGADVAGNRSAAYGAESRLAGAVVGLDRGDGGGASRFYPVFRFNPKADTWERPTIVREGADRGKAAASAANRCALCGKQDLSGSRCQCPEPQWVPRNGGDVISHPTVKPVDLMRWLVRLVTPPGGLVLDPFAGSGATLQAAQVEGFRSVGVELDPGHCALIAERLSWPVRIDRDGKFERIRAEPVPDGQGSLLELLEGGAA